MLHLWNVLNLRGAFVARGEQGHAIDDLYKIAGIEMIYRALGNIVPQNHLSSNHSRIVGSFSIDAEAIIAHSG